MVDSGAQRIEQTLRSVTGPALVAYLMAGYPSPAVFPTLLKEAAEVADVIEVGVPFSDPIADGGSIQQAGFEALSHGVSLPSILDQLGEIGPELDAPYLLMGYYNPFLAYGFDKLGSALASAGVSGLIVPDLTLEESSRLYEPISSEGIGLVRLATPATTSERLAALGEATEGFLYAVTTKGITGGKLEIPDELLGYLGRAREATDRPVMAGFGIRDRGQIDLLAPHVDGVVVGSALVEEIAAGRSPAVLLESLRG